MIDVTIHYRGAASEQRRLPAVPVVWSYVRHAGCLWQVSAVVVNGDQVAVCAVHVSAILTSELTAWAT